MPGARSDIQVSCCFSELDCVSSEKRRSEMSEVTPLRRRRDIREASKKINFK